MSPVSSMVLAAMLGSACDTDMTNINDCNATLCNAGNCPQAIQYQRDGQDLNSMLSRMGVSMMSGNSQCGISWAYYYAIVFPRK